MVTELPAETPPAVLERMLERLDDPETKVGWAPLLIHATTAVGKSRPTRKLVREARPLIETVGPSAFRDQLVGWLGGWDFAIPDDWDLFEAEKGEREILRGLIWASAPHVDAGLCSALADFAIRCFKKIPDCGPAAPKLGNAAAYVLSQLEGTSGVGALARVSNRTRYPSARRQIERYLDEAAERAGLSREQLEEMSVPGYGLADGKLEVSFGDVSARLAIDNAGNAAVKWIRSDGKAQKSVPKSVKDGFADELEAFKRETKELAATAAAQAARVERLWLRRVSIPIANLTAHYLDHPLVGLVARRLVWRVETRGVRVPAFWRGGRLTSLGDPVEVDGESSAKLMHPTEFESIESLLVWRDWLLELGVVQPFAQLYRDTYRPSVDGRTDDRFAGHILLQSAVRSRCQANDWRFEIFGGWDGGWSPTLALPDHGLEVSFEVGPVGPAGEHGVFKYLTTGNVLLSQPGERIDPVVYSEVMRAIADLVARATIATDEHFDLELAVGFDEYWPRRAWGELAPAAELRAEALAAVLGRTTLRDIAAIDGRWLVIAGERQHRMHLGSGLIEGEDGRPVTVRIKPKAKRLAAEVFLPYEGDALLRSMIARAFALAGLT